MLYRIQGGSLGWVSRKKPMTMRYFASMQAYKQASASRVAEATLQAQRSATSLIIVDRVAHFPLSFLIGELTGWQLYVPRYVCNYGQLTP